jgi:hypothetical protein
MLPDVAFRRLWLNQWSSGASDAVSEELIEQAFDANLRPMTGRESSFVFVGGVDLGLVRDGASVVVLGVGKRGTREAGRIRLAAHRLWRPMLGKKISLIEIEKHLLEVDRQYHLRSWRWTRGMPST